METTIMGCDASKRGRSFCVLQFSCQGLGFELIWCCTWWAVRSVAPTVRYTPTGYDRAELSLLCVCIKYLYG